MSEDLIRLDTYDGWMYFLSIPGSKLPFLIGIYFLPGRSKIIFIHMSSEFAN